MGLYQRRFLQNSFRCCGSQFIGIIFMKNTKKQLYFESLESTIYQWFGRTVRKHNSKYYCETYNNHQRQVSRVTANLSEVLCRSDFRTIYYFQSLISTLQSLLGLCLGLGLCLQATSPLLRFPNVWFEYIPPLQNKRILRKTGNIRR